MSVIENDRPAMADKGLKGGSLGLVAVIVIGVASTAPGYSLAASVGFVTGEVGAKAPFIMLFAFVPMACIAASFYYLNKADPDCGTNFTWGVRAFGPKAGWIAGWGCIVADLVIMPNLAGISGQYLVLLFSESAADNIWLTTFIGILFIIAMTWICWKGIELSARSQVLLLGTELVVLAVFAVIALSKSFGDGISRTGRRRHLQLGEAEPVVAVAVGRQLECDHRRPRRRRVHLLGLGHVRLGERRGEGLGHHARAAPRCVSTLILLAIYLIVTFGAVSLLGPDFVTDKADEALFELGKAALPDSWSSCCVISILTSAAASCQTTILPATRTMLSMGSHGAAPPKLAQIDRKRLTPELQHLAVRHRVDRLVRAAGGDQQQHLDRRVQRVDRRRRHGDRRLLRAVGRVVHRLLPTLPVEDRRRTSC